MIKTYQIKDTFSSKRAIRFTTNKGKSKIAEFESHRKNGLLTFRTADKELQEAIEKSRYFKQTITLIGQVEDPNAHQNENPEAPPVDPNDENQDPPAGPPADPNPPTEYPEVTTLKAARVILEEEFGVDPSEMNNREKVSAKAAEMGVSFPNIPPAKE